MAYFGLTVVLIGGTITWLGSIMHSSEDKQKLKLDKSLLLFIHLILKLKNNLILVVYNQSDLMKK